MKKGPGTGSRRPGFSPAYCLHLCLISLKRLDKCFQLYLVGLARLNSWATPKTEWQLLLDSIILGDHLHIEYL